MENCSRSAESRGPGIAFAMIDRGNGVYRVGGVPRCDAAGGDESWVYIDLEEPVLSEALDIALGKLGIARSGRWFGAARPLENGDLMIVAWREVLLNAA